MGALDGKVALVTGGSRGIGRAITERLARDGAVVAVAYARDRAAADEVVTRVRDTGGRAFAIQAELGVPGDAARLWAAFDAQVEAHAPGGGVDIIVNNAGIGCDRDLASLTEAEFDQVFAVNVRAPFFIVQHGLKRLRDGGRIINISSGAARLAMPNGIAYGSTKGALDTFTLNLAKELGARGITANSVAPGIIDTDINAGWLRDNPEAQANAGALAALGRVGQPEDVADIVAFLASDDARWVTGRVVDATGGSGL
ncbi:SDR family oxidoreductase [Goodfellowiella coeruleoviolacea]|uniref:NAD(P)-dependent dehydrogenase, short-chain alcohol dehydrogenase family n=1 Tax=Goodfellowiella coeruleoviolacea TaxID=334858 RepID=A0AAE3GAE9_9PSEU|nr:SDR family oxidoreductase [Goodfellowiella coeruleoviolacea]MCP2164485.1 NAD(P)-dependent dehydrogenase, short-chain alcohol dehydrogenase family [Goodfellowiella coeruleoviolacea]